MRRAGNKVKLKLKRWPKDINTLVGEVFKVAVSK